MSEARRRFVSLEAGAEYLGLSTDTLRRRIADGTLPAYRIGNKSTLRVRMDDVEKLAVRVPVGLG